MWVLRNILPLTLFFLFILAIAASYLRFVHNLDYIVEYEIDCNPEYYSCFVGCEDDECAAKYHYAIAQKYAKDLFAQCGKDITDCDHAQICLPEDEGRCNITYCDNSNENNDCVTLELNMDSNTGSGLYETETEDDLIFDNNQLQYDM